MEMFLGGPLNTRFTVYSLSQAQIWVHILIIGPLQLSDDPYLVSFLGESFQDYSWSLEFEASFVPMEGQPQNTELSRLL